METDTPSESPRPSDLPQGEACAVPFCSDSGGAAAEVEEILAVRIAVAAKYKCSLSDESIERDLAWAQWARSMSGDDLGWYLRFLLNNVILREPSMEHALREILRRVKDSGPRPNKYDDLLTEFRSQNDIYSYGREKDDQSPPSQSQQ